MNPRDLLGRERERRSIDELVAQGESGPAVMTFVGEPGSGRTALVALASVIAAEAGRRVLTVSGSRVEANVPLSGLSHLLLPFGDQIELLPSAQRDALRRPLGLVPDDAPFDLVAMGMAVLSLMTMRAEAPALLVAVDDADFVDTETLSVLAFIAQRVERSTVVLLLTAQPLGVPAVFQWSATRLHIGRLVDSDAHILLQRQGLPLDAALRQKIVAQSGGSPLALLETAARAILPGGAPRPFREPLRVGRVIEERVMARFRLLPTDAQDWLTDAAVAESYASSATALEHDYHDGLEGLGSAERSGMVTVDHSGVRFTHPAYWVAIYHSTPFALRVEAHRRIAESLTAQPLARAWHLGRAATEPDEAVAALLEATAGDVGRQLGRLEKALTLERAGELSPDNDERARRFLAAATTAAATGELEWVDALIARALACARDPRLRVSSMVTSAWAAAARGRFGSAMADLSQVASDTIDASPGAAAEVLSIAAAVGYQSGSRAAQAQLLAAARQLLAVQATPTSFEAARLLWIETFFWPSTDTSDRVARLVRLSDEGPTDEPTLSRLAGAAWLSDETERAFDLADAAYQRLTEQGSFASAALLGPIRSFTAWDTGRWDDALEFAAHATRVAEAAGEGMLRATDHAVAALVYAARGDGASSAARVLSALAVVQGEECLSVAARTHHALGLSAMAAGKYSAAYGQLARMFREDGAPLHWHISYFGLGDLASAARRGEQLEVARQLLRHVLDRLPPDPATRIRHIVLRARAVLAEDDDEAERFFSAAHGDTEGSRWPFERAKLLLDYGSWLRRKRRVSEAKALLIGAHQIFDELGAVPWKALAEAELRASHVDVPGPLGSLDDLTWQQREIVLLAGQGLTNREIAARMYLSPRTVASHLYRSFPKLGIRDRWQLRDLIDPTEKPSPGSVASL